MHRRVFAVCALTSLLAAGCSHSPPNDANTTCQRHVERSGLHGQIVSSFGSNLGHMAPMALNAIPGAGGMGAGMAGMGMQQAMNSFGMDTTHGHASSRPFPNDGEDPDPLNAPSFPCQPDAGPLATGRDQDIQFGEEK